jgi:hypothetical protein
MCLHTLTQTHTHKHTHTHTALPLTHHLITQVHVEDHVYELGEGISPLFAKFEQKAPKISGNKGRGCFTGGVASGRVPAYQA